MKKRLLLLGIIIFFVTSCGLNVFYEIDSPLNATIINTADGNEVQTPTYSNEFEFSARNLSSSSFINPGTEVFYRIYDNQEALQADADKINDANDDDTSNGYRMLLDLNYTEMRSINSKGNPIIDRYGGFVRIIITNTENNADIIVSGVSTGNKPIRYNDNFFNFDVEKEDVGDSLFNVPRSGDTDFEFTSESNNYRFINAYAVSTGMDQTTFTPIQSQVLSLGFAYYEVN